MNYLLEPRLSLRDEDFFFFFLRPSFEERFAGDGDLLCFPRRPRPPLSSALLGGVSGLRRGAGNCACVCIEQFRWRNIYLVLFANIIYIR